MSRTARETMIAAILIAIASLWIVSAHARADVPREIAVEGVVTDATGHLLEGEHRIVVRLYADGRVLHDETQDALVEAGAFVVLLGTVRPLAEGLFGSGAEWELGVAIDGDPEMSPRIPITSVPFALEAEHAARAEHAVSADRVGAIDASDVQPRITGSCAVGASIRAIDEHGAVTCEPAPDTTNLQQRVASSCAVGESIRAIDDHGAVTCELDDRGPTYVAGAGITIRDDQVAVDTTFVQRRIAVGCLVGQSIRAIDASGRVTCEPGLAPRVEAASWTNRIGTFGTSTVAMGPAARRVCFLTSVGMRELDVTEDQGECVVAVRADGQWHLDAVLGLHPERGGSTDAYVTCRAQCLAW